MTAVAVVALALAAVLVCTAAVLRERRVPAGGRIGRDVAGRAVAAAAVVAGALAAGFLLGRMIVAAA